MEINHKVLEKLALLSALKINTSKETQELKDYLTKTLSHFEQIKNIDTKQVPPLINPLNPSLKLRADQAENFPNKNQLLEQAPQKQGNLIKVPATV